MLKFDAERGLLDTLGLDIEIPDAGCCGMAGSLGFESRHYDVSMSVGERVLLPAVRPAAQDTLIIADGFSCREPIAQATGRHALHLAEVLASAIRRERGATSAELVSASVANGRDGHAGALTAAVLGAGAFAVSAALLWRSRHGGERGARVRGLRRTR